MCAVAARPARAGSTPAARTTGVGSAPAARARAGFGRGPRPPAPAGALAADGDDRVAAGMGDQVRLDGRFIRAGAGPRAAPAPGRRAPSITARADDSSGGRSGSDQPPPRSMRMGTGS